MICSKCGKEIPDGVLFCSACGAETEYGAAAEPEIIKVPAIGSPWKLVSLIIGAVLAAALAACLLFALLPRHQKPPAKLFEVCDLSFEGYTFADLKSYAEGNGLQPDETKMKDVSVVEVYVDLTSLQEGTVIAEEMLAEYYDAPLTLDHVKENAEKTESLLEFAKEQKKAAKKAGKESDAAKDADETPEEKPAVNPLPTFWLFTEDDVYLMRPEGYYDSGNVCPWIPKNSAFPEGETPTMCELTTGQYFSLVLGAAGKFDEAAIEDSYIAACYGDAVYFWDLTGRMESGREIHHGLEYYNTVYGSFAKAAFAPKEQPNAEQPNAEQAETK